MTNEAFNKGFEALTATFPSMNLNARLYWTMLSDLDGQFFLMAVYEFIKNTKEVYPGTNMIAIIRERAEALKTQAQAEKVLKITAETEKQRIERWQKNAAPMPEECRRALEKMGVLTHKEALDI